MSSPSSQAKKAKVVEITTNPNWLQLLTDITSNILQRLDTVTILMTARTVCSLWWNICKDPLMWRTIDMGRDYIYPLIKCFEDYDSLRMMCRYAVDLSCGHLEDIRIYYFGNIDLLNYIADRANHLRCIKFENCPRISGLGMCEVAKKLPLVEEFYTTFGHFSKSALKAIGRSCPLLKSLKFDGLAWKSIGTPYDEEAFAIAKTMPELRYLDINGNFLSDVGLTAILDGCPLLKSLDIRKCRNLEFSGNLWKRFHDQVKDVQAFDNYSSYSDIPSVPFCLLF